MKKTLKKSFIDKFKWQYSEDRQYYAANGYFIVRAGSLSTINVRHLTQVANKQLADSVLPELEKNDRVRYVQTPIIYTNPTTKLRMFIRFDAYKTEDRIHLFFNEEYLEGLQIGDELWVDETLHCGLTNKEGIDFAIMAITPKANENIIDHIQYLTNSTK